MIKGAFIVLGSIEVLGNPVGLFSSIGTGVVDLFEKPIEGMVQGPLEAGKGVLIGAGSLVKNTLAGTMNSLHKITGSLAIGLSSLTFDEEFLRARKKMKMRKPKNVF